MRTDQLLRGLKVGVALVIAAACISLAAASDNLTTDWSGMDIGGALPPGSASLSKDTFTIYGHGGGITPTSDTFHFVFRAVSQDCSFVARIAKMTPSGDGAFAGVMIRDALATTSDFAAVITAPTVGASFTYRNITAPNLSADAGPAASTPIWLKLVRRGTTVEGYFAADVNNAPGPWQQLGSDEPIGSGMVYIGLCVSAKRPGSCNATIDNVTYTEGAAPGLESGVYRIIPMSATAMALDARADAAEGSALHLAAIGTAPSQKWVITYKSDGAYLIQPSNKPSLSVATNSKTLTNGSKLFLSATQPPENCLWNISPLGDGVFGIQLHSTLTFGIDNFGGGTGPDAVIDTYGYNSADQHEQWAIVLINKTFKPRVVESAGLDDGTYTLSPIHGPDMNLAALPGGPGGSLMAALAKQAPDANQKWVFTNKGNDWFRIRPSSDATLSLTVASTSSANGTRLIVAKDQGLPTQLWRIESGGNGSIRLSPKSAPGTAIDDPGSSVTVGTPTQIWEMDRGNLNLQWLINGAHREAACTTFRQGHPV